MHKTPSLGFLFTLKMSFKKSTTQSEIWSLYLVNGVTALSYPGEVGSDFVLVRWSSEGIPGESVGDACLWTREDCLREASSSWISSGCASVAAPASMTLYQQMSFPFAITNSHIRKALENYSSSRNAFHMFQGQSFLSFSLSFFFLSVLFFK